MANYIRSPVQVGEVMLAPGEDADQVPGVTREEIELLKESGYVSEDPAEIFDPATGQLQPGVTGNMQVNPMGGVRSINTVSGKALNDPKTLSPALAALGFTVEENGTISPPSKPKDLSPELQEKIQMNALSGISTTDLGRCNAIKRNGEPCPVRPIKDGYCAFHQNYAKEKEAEGRKTEETRGRDTGPGKR